MIDWDKYEHFSRWEFDSHLDEGSGEKMNEAFIDKLHQARKLAGIAFKINSGYRTPQHNKLIGGSPNSSHMGGYAADISATDSITRYKILTALIHVGFNRIGIADTFIHVDNDPEKVKNVIWTY